MRDIMTVFLFLGCVTTIQGLFVREYISIDIGNVVSMDVPYIPTMNRWTELLYTYIVYILYTYQYHHYYYYGNLHNMNLYVEICHFWGRI